MDGVRSPVGRPLNTIPAESSAFCAGVPRQCAECQCELIVHKHRPAFAPDLWLPRSVILEQQIWLADKTPFAEGATRRVYAHPRDSGKCLKIERTDSFAEKTARRKFRRLRPAVLNQNIRDGRGYLYLEMLRLPAARFHVPEFYGFRQTDLGGALCAELVRDADGGIARTMPERVAQPAGESLRTAAAEFVSFMRELFAEVSRRPEIPAVSGHVFEMQNLIAARLPDGRERIYLCEYRHSLSWQRYLSAVKTRQHKKNIARVESWFARHLR